MAGFVFSNRHFDGPAKTTMHKRNSDNGNDAIKAEISVTICPRRLNGDHEISLEANCWLRDKDGRRQFLFLPHDTLCAIAQAINTFDVEATANGEQMKAPAITAKRN